MHGIFSRTLISAGLALLFPLFLSTCVTETKRRTVSVHAGRTGKIYPSASYYGQWFSGMGVLKFQRPPAAAVVLTPHSRPYRAAADDYKISAVTRNRDGSETFVLEPVNSGLKRKMTLKVESKKRIRETGDFPRLWRRMGSTAP